jgi:hypothetical protein
MWGSDVTSNKIQVTEPLTSYKLRGGDVGRGVVNKCADDFAATASARDSVGIDLLYTHRSW